MKTLKDELASLGFRPVYEGPLNRMDEKELDLFSLYRPDLRATDSVLAFVGPHQADADDFSSEIDASVEAYLKRQQREGKTRVFDSLVSLQDAFGLERAWGLVLVLRKK